jgi:hypothetical protein
VVPPADAAPLPPPPIVVPPPVIPPDDVVPDPKSVEAPPPPAVKPLPPLIAEPPLPPVAPQPVERSQTIDLQLPPAPAPITKPMPQPGEATMNAIKIAMSAIVGAALLSAPAKAVEPPKPDPRVDAKDDVSKTIERLEAAVKKLETIEQSMTEYKASNTAAMKQVTTALDTMKIKIEILEEELKILRKAAKPDSTSKRATNGDAAAKMGRVKLSNEYPEEMSIVVNGTAHRLVPGETKTINVPAGVFTYQVLQLQRNVQERTIAADEEKPIRIYNQQPAPAGVSYYQSYYPPIFWPW